MLANIICLWLELLQQLLCLIDNSLVLQYRAVVGKVDGRWLGRQSPVDSLSVGIALAEGLEGSNGL